MCQVRAATKQKEISDKEISELKLRSAFDKLDVHGSGHLSTVNIQEAVRSVYDRPTMMKVDEVMRYADRDCSDGTFRFEGFRKVVAQELALQSTNAAARLGAAGFCRSEALPVRRPRPKVALMVVVLRSTRPCSFKSRVHSPWPAL